mgnify:CR=1 FL=1
MWGGAEAARTDLLGTFAGWSAQALQARARLHSVATGAGSMWLEALPTSPRLRISNPDFELALQLRLGLVTMPTDAPSVRCECTMQLQPHDIDHAMTCRSLGSARVMRHNYLLEGWRHQASRAGVASSAEPGIRRVEEAIARGHRAALREQERAEREQQEGQPQPGEAQQQQPQQPQREEGVQQREAPHGEMEPPREPQHDTPQVAQPVLAFRSSGEHLSGLALQRPRLGLSRPLGGLYLFPVGGLLIGGFVAALVAKDMRMSGHHLVGDVAHHIVKGEMSGLFTDLRVIDRLQQKIAQFAL